jgi:hypothetical protein
MSGKYCMKLCGLDLSGLTYAPVEGLVNAVIRFPSKTGDDA